MKKILALLICLSSIAAIAQPKKVISNGRIAMQTKLVVDSLYIIKPNGDTVDVFRYLDSIMKIPVLLDTTLKNDENGLGLDWTSQRLIDSIAKYGADGTGGGGGSGTVGSGSANRLAYYASSGTSITNLAAITASRALASDASGLPVASTVTAAELAYLSGVTSSIQTQLNSKLSSVNLNTGYSGTTVTVTNDAGTSSSITGPTTSNAGIFTSALYNYFFTVGSATWGIGNVSVSALNQKHNINITGSGGRTLAFAFLDAGEVIAMHIDNTSGGTITLTLPSNSYVQNPTTGEYQSAASVTVITGKSSLYLSKYDGTNYWFVY